MTDLPMWGARACDRIFSYGNGGNIYQNESSAWTLAHSAANSTGNGMEYFVQDRALYYAQDTTFGRLLDACTGSTFTDDFLSTEGGESTNTHACDFEASSSQYASRADTASTSITSDLSLEVYAKPESLPSTGSTMTLVSKWDDNSAKSYKMDIGTESNFFGDGSDGNLTISSNTTEAPIDANCTGTSGTQTLTVSNVTGSFVAGQKIMIHQSRGTGAGTVQYNTIQSVSGSTLTLEDNLTFSPVHSATASVANKAQVRVLKQYADVTINNGITYTCKAWNGLKGGIIGWLASGTVTIAGTVSAKGKGFLSPVVGQDYWGYQGEGNVGAGGTESTSSNGTGGGAGNGTNNTSIQQPGGGGGGHAYSGGNGSAPGGEGTGGTGGTTSGSSNLTSMTFGGAGGGGAGRHGGGTVWWDGGKGGNGGGIVCSFGVTTTVTGVISVDGNNGTDGETGDSGAGGGGAGGSILIKGQTATLGSGLLTASAGLRTAGEAGNGSVGRIHVDYFTSYSGSTSPTITSSQDAALGNVDGYVVRLLVSDDGSASETYRQSVDITTSAWARWQVTWDASLSTATFYKNGVELGTDAGSKTAIDDNASTPAIACDFDTTAQNFFDGIIDDVRVWNDIRTESELISWNGKVLVGTEANLVAYWKLDNDYTDSQTSGNNDLTASNAPVFTVDVPFNGLTTRNDQDQANDQTGNTYTLTTTIDETATHKQTFSPEKDPQESIEVDIAVIGTGDWTMTVHDSLNREAASTTVANGDLNTGIYEFVFDSVWRPIIGSSYHFHLTSTVADGTVVTGTASDLETARFWSHYQFLVSDTYHPMANFIDFMAIGNERYLATFEAGDTFDPHRLTFPAEYRVRAIGYWREFIAIGCWRGDDITDYDDGRVFFWDGISDTYNHQIPIPEGGVNALFGTQDVLFIVAGYSGEILVYSGGGAAQKLNKIPQMSRDEKVEVAPGAMSMWRSLIHLGVDLSTDSESIYKGVYTIGTSNRVYQTSLGFDFDTSLGTQTSSGVSIGMIYPSGQDLYVGWQNGNAYGIDKVSVNNDVFSEGTVEALISSMGSISKKQYPLILRADFKPLLTGESIRVKYKADRESEWKTSDYEDTVGAKDIRLKIPERMKEIQVACDLKTTVSTSPTLLGVTIEVESEERSKLNA